MSKVLTYIPGHFNFRRSATPQITSDSESHIEL
jgi:hypothetical protein